MKELLHQKLILFALAGLLISIKADGRFPLPASLSESQFQFLLLPYTLIFISTIVLFFRTRKFVRIPSISLIRLASWIAIVFLAMIVLIFFWQEKKYSAFGYHVHRMILLTGSFAGVIALLRIALKDGSPKRFLLTTSLIFAMFYAFSIFWFPLTPDRSDMLPLIQAACERFFMGEPPYMVYSLPHLVPLTYLPGMWLAYLPAVVLDFDVRWIHAAAILASVWIFYAVDHRKEMAASFGSVLLLTPYLLYRHEIYLGILWLALSIVYFFEQKDRSIFASIFTGLAASISQFAWVLAPFYLLGIYQRSGWKKAATGVVFCIAGFLAIVLPFVIQRPASFYDGVFAHWSHTFNATTFNFSYFLLIPFSTSNLKFFQAAAIVLFLYCAWKSTPDRRYEWMTYALLSFILLNPLIWVYFYLTLFVLMLADVCRQDARRQGARR